MGISENGSKNDKHREPEGELLLRQETKEIISSYGMREYGVPLFSVVSDLENK